MVGATAFASRIRRLGNVALRYANRWQAVRQLRDALLHRAAHALEFNDLGILRWV